VEKHGQVVSAFAAGVESAPIVEEIDAIAAGQSQPFLVDRLKVARRPRAALAMRWQIAPHHRRSCAAVPYSIRRPFDRGDREGRRSACGDAIGKGCMPWSRGRRAGRRALTRPKTPASATETK